MRKGPHRQSRVQQARRHEGIGVMLLSPCLWTEKDEGYGSVWEAACGSAWFPAGDESPSEYEMKYCCFCGKPLQEREMEVTVTLGELP